MPRARSWTRRPEASRSWRTGPRAKRSARSRTLRIRETSRACGSDRRGRHRATRATGNARQEGGLVTGQDLAHAAGFGELAGQARQHAARCRCRPSPACAYARGGSRRADTLRHVAKAPRFALQVPFAPREVDEEVVDRCHLDDRGWCPSSSMRASVAPLRRLAAWRVAAPEHRVAGSGVPPPLRAHARVARPKARAS